MKARGCEHWRWGKAVRHATCFFLPFPFQTNSNLLCCVANPISSPPPFHTPVISTYLSSLLTPFLSAIFITCTLPLLSLSNPHISLSLSLFLKTPRTKYNTLKVETEIYTQKTLISNTMISVASSIEPQNSEVITSPTHQNQPSETSINTTTTTTTTASVFKSKLPDITISNNQPLHTYCFENLSQFSDRPCLIIGSTGKTYTFAETHLICLKIAAGLSNLGIKKGDCVMILLQNCAEFIFSFIAASMIGAVTTTANPFYTSAEVFKQFTASRAKLIITQSLYVEKLREPGENYPKLGDDFIVITVDDPPEKCLHFSVISEANETEIPIVSIDPDDPVALPFSSGTTGLPKGVILTHKSLVTSVAQQVDGENPNLYLKPEDVVLCVLPLFHIYSLNSVLLCSLRAGAAVLLMQKFEIGTLLELIQRHRVSVAAVVPPLVLALAKNPIVEKFDLSSIRVVLSGAAPLGKELEEALRSRVPQAVLGQVCHLRHYTTLFLFYFTKKKYIL